MTAPLRIGVVGYGTGGQHFHAPFIAAAKGLELAGVVARAPATVAKIQADLPGIPVYLSLKAMLEAGVDAVTITTRRRRGGTWSPNRSCTTPSSSLMHSPFKTSTD